MFLRRREKLKGTVEDSSEKGVRVITIRKTHFI